MIDEQTAARIRRLFYAEHWKIGTIAAQLGLHRDTVCRALRTDRFHPPHQRRPRLTDPYREFIREILEKHPTLRATRIHQMIAQRGYRGGVVPVRRLVRELRPRVQEAFLRLRAFPGEEGQVDWAHFGQVRIGAAQRRLSCLVMTLSYSRAIAAEFFFEQTLESLLAGHVRAFAAWGGSPRRLLYDNMKSVVADRYGEAVRFHPRLLELAAHYRFAPRVCAPARANQKGRVERAIRYLRESYFAGRPFTTLEELNRQVRQWIEEVAHRRPWPEDRSRSVDEVLQEERDCLLALPAHPLETDRLLSVHPRKSIYVRFDLNDYSVPPEAVGRTLTLAVSGTRVRILEGSRELARHRRSFDRGQVVADPAHQQQLLELKRKAHGAAPSDRLACVPESEAFLRAGVLRGESAARLSVQLGHLLDEYGAEALRQALKEALDRGTPRASSVAFLLRRQGRPPQPALDLSRSPRLARLHVQPHDPEDYDELCRTDNDAAE